MGRQKALLKEHVFVMHIPLGLRRAQRCILCADSLLSHLTREKNLLVERRASPTCPSLYSKPGTRALAVLTAVLGAALRSHPLLNLDNSADCWNLLFICDGLMAAVTDPHFKLEAHQRDGGAFGAALTADSLPALAAVVLEGERTGTH